MLQMKDLIFHTKIRPPKNVTIKANRLHDFLPLVTHVNHDTPWFTQQVLHNKTYTMSTNTSSMARHVPYTVCNISQTFKGQYEHVLTFDSTSHKFNITKNSTPHLHNQG